MAKDCLVGEIFAIFVGLFFLLPVEMSAASTTLKMVNVVYRHGDRSPFRSYPTDPHRDKWPQGLGWLTTLGMQQQYALGQFLRSEYGNLLNSTYKHTEIEVRSSDMDRCLMSAYSNLAGLYPPQGSQVWNDHLLWQPIPVPSRPQREDRVLAMSEECARYDQLHEEELRSPAVKDVEKVNSDFFEYVKKHSGLKTLHMDNVWELHDNLLCTKTHNYSLPDWAEAKLGNITVYDKLHTLAILSYKLRYRGNQLSRLKGGPLLKVFIENMQKAAQQEQFYRMYMYSAHDSTVLAVMAALDMSNGVLPPYASALLVELHQTQSAGYCVLVRYRNDTHVPPFILIHPDCSTECCPLDEFVAVTKPRVPEDWDAECGNQASNNDCHDFAEFTGALIGVSCLLVLLLLASLVAVYRFRQRGDDKASLSSP